MNRARLAVEDGALDMGEIGLSGCGWGNGGRMQDSIPISARGRKETTNCGAVFSICG